MVKRKQPETDPLKAARGTCQQCAHWHAGECRRYPPASIVGPTEEGDDSPLYVWPLTTADEWCGEFRGNN